MKVRISKILNLVRRQLENKQVTVREGRQRVPQLALRPLKLLPWALGLWMVGHATAQTYEASAAKTAPTYRDGANYANPDSNTTKVYSSSRKICADPWVSIALINVYGYPFDPVHCDARNFNGGQWSDYNQLVHSVARYKNDLASGRIAFFASFIGGQNMLIVAQGGTAIAIAKPADQNLVSAVDSSGRKIAGNMVAAGGGNMVAAGGGNMVAAGGGNMVAAGGGNLVDGKGNRLVGNAMVVTGLPPANILARAPQSGRSIRVGSRLIHLP